jgi:hypothetical protein
MKSALAKVRKQLMISGNSEHELLANGSLKDLFDQIQELKREMNIAKREAADAAAVPYLEAISSLERNYAIVAKLSSR